MKFLTRRISLMLLGCVLLVLQGCATVTNPDPRDPWESMNRSVYKFNDALDTAAIQPAAKAYVAVLPSPVRTGIHNFLGNLGDVWSMANSALQLKGQATAETFMRITVNTFLGLGGVLDVASEMRLEKRKEDFGQTFSVWGIGSGPFVMLPALGPSTVTDTAGTVLDFLFNPIELFESDATQYGLRAVDVIDTRAELMTVESVISGDRYLFMRDAYLQLRAFEVKNGEIDVEDDPFLDDFEDEEEY